MQLFGLGACLLAACAVVQGGASSLPQEFGVESGDELVAVDARALPNAPDGYAPANVTCPSSRPTIRSAGSGLSKNETAWLKIRRNHTVESMRTFLSRVNITNFDASAYINKHAHNASALPNIAIAASGGGWRALLNGAGAIQAFDNRTRNSTAKGQLGGLLQSSTYLAGLSGGGWLVGSLVINNWTTVTALLNDDTGSVWDFENSILEGPSSGGIQLLSTVEYYDDIYDDVSDKQDAGFNVSLTDYWGRAISYQMINATNGGPAYTFSSISLTSTFKTAHMPFPILVADGRSPGETVISSNATVFEFNPFEFGTFDPTVYGFAPTKYLGTNFTAGSVAKNANCVRGFDNAGFIMGTSSSLFNTVLTYLSNDSLPSIVYSAITSILTELGSSNNDIADYTPNPFYHYHASTNPGADSKRLTLVDGGEDLQNIPFHPLLRRSRGVDVVFAIDSSADTTTNWPNGTAMVATYERSLDTSLTNGTWTFPSIPDTNTFVNLGLNRRPTFFGCDAGNNSDPSHTPLIVYLPNTPYVYHSNYSTMTLSYNTSVRNAIVENGYAIATRANGSIDEQWPACVGCAVIWRSLNRTGTTVPDICNTCFDRYCWNGTTNSTKPSGSYEPDYVTTALNSTSTSGSTLQHVMTLGVLAYLPPLMALVLAL